MDDHRSTLLERARHARALTTHIDSMFHAMPWTRNMRLNPRQSYWELLSFLYVLGEEPITKSECLRRLGDMSTNTANYQLNALLRANVLKARNHPYDRRAKAVSLTQETLEELDKFFSSFDSKFEMFSDRGREIRRS